MTPVSLYLSTSDLPTHRNGSYEHRSCTNFKVRIDLEYGLGFALLHVSSVGMLHARFLQTVGLADIPL